MGSRNSPPQTRTEYRWLLPAELARLDEDAPRRRTARDWFVDAVLFAFAVLMWWGVGEMFDYTPIPAWMEAIDPWVGAAGCLSLWLRRRYPVILAAVFVPALIVSATVFGAVLIIVLTVAVHRSWIWAAPFTAVYLSMSVIYSVMYPNPNSSLAADLVWICLMYLLPLTMGMTVRARRQLVASVRRDAAHERAEHASRVAAARLAERQSIAREMHDVLAHRLSLLSVHAGALAYRSERAEAGGGAALDVGEVREAIDVIRDSARHALEELGEVLNVLRVPDDSAPAVEAGPAPTLSDVHRLAEEARAAGQRVDVEIDDDPERAQDMRPQLQRTVYRTVQEGLTNARKHASGAAVSVRVVVGDDVVVTVTNPLSPGAGEPIAGFGMGLTGLSERVAVDGGSLEHGAKDGVFRLTARIPWQA
ncbi:MAG: sensor histidine kinase [Stackebrandtia sp.]